MTTKSKSSIGQQIRRTTALVAATTLLSQNFAWATCSDGSTLPAGGYLIGQPPLPIADNFAPATFTSTNGSAFVPDNSVCENNEGTIQANGQIGLPCLIDPSTGNPFPATGGGHNWAFDQGSTTCRQIDTTYNAQTAPPGIAPGSETWKIPPVDGSQCMLLPVIKSVSIGPNAITVVFQGIGDIPYQGDFITPTCDPTKLSTVDPVTGLTNVNLLNTRINQLGCSISHGVATDKNHADSYAFVSGIKGTMFRYILTNNGNNTQVGVTGGKVVGSFDYFAHIFTLNGGPKVDTATISPDGRFAVTTSTRRQQQVYTCLEPLGNPGDPNIAINPNYFIPSLQDYTRTKCLVSGNNGLAVDLVTMFGADDQPYFGGQRVIQSFQSNPGGATMPGGQPPSAFFSPVAWPQCHYNGNNNFSQPVPPGFTLFQNLERVFNISPLQGNLTQPGQSGQCGTAQPNGGIFSTLATQPQTLPRHGGYYDSWLPGYMSGPGNTGTWINNPNLTTLSVQGYTYTGPVGGTVDQIKIGVDPISLTSVYKHRTYVSGLPGITTGIGVADDLTYPGGAGLIDPFTGQQPGSLITMEDKSAIGSPGQEALTRMPLCEDIQ